jgi:hypothetical protein
MGLSWNEIKSKALLFSNTWGDAIEQAAQCVLGAVVDATYQPSGGKKTMPQMRSVWRFCLSCISGLPVCCLGWQTRKQENPKLNEGDRFDRNK